MCTVLLSQYIYSEIPRLINVIQFLFLPIRKIDIKTISLLPSHSETTGLVTESGLSLLDIGTCTCHREKNRVLRQIWSETHSEGPTQLDRMDAHTVKIVQSSRMNILKPLSKVSLLRRWCVNIKAGTALIYHYHHDVISTS